MEIHYELRFCSPPFINRLVRVTYYKKITMTIGNQFHQCVLLGIGILELINLYVMEFILPLCKDIPVVQENIKGEIDQIIKINGIVFLLLPQITVKNPFHHIPAFGNLFVKSLKGQHVVYVCRLILSCCYIVKAIGKCNDL